MKTVLIASLLLLFFGTSLNAQFTGRKGLTVQATTALYIQDDEPKSVSVDQVYAASFNDKILTHVIYSDGNVSESQIYQIRNDVNFVDDTRNTVYRFDAVSGVSGSTYRYEIKIDPDGKLLSLKITQPGGENTVYKGGISELKTYKQ